MRWEILIPIIAQYGLPLAERLWQKWASNADPTQADWDELKALGVQTMETQVLAALIRNGIPLDSPKAKEMLDLIKPQV